MNAPYLSIIIPAYNESKRIGSTLENVTLYLQQANLTFEIIVVNDGSTDETLSVLENLKTKIPELQIINNLENMGKGYSIQCGMLSAVGALRLFMDADNSVNISELRKFIPKINEGYDVVVGSIGLGDAIVNENNGYFRRPIGQFSKFITRLLVTPGIYDTQRGFKLFTRNATELIFPKLSVHRFGFDIELLVIARANNLKIKELPVEFNNPKGSTVGVRSYIATFFELIKILIKKYSGEYKSSIDEY